MSSYPRRDPKTDHLITPENSALLIIDYQPTQVNSITSMNHFHLVQNIVHVARLAKGYGLPIVLSTVNVGSGVNKDTIPQLKEVLQGIPSYDRTTINSWEDEQFNKAVRETGRRKLIICALWTEACLTFPSLDALAEGFEVYPVVDAVGGTSVVAHEAGLRRVEQAGGTPVSIAQLACELQRDWLRKDTVGTMVSVFRDSGIFLDLESSRH